MSDALLQAIVSGNPLDLPGLGSNDNGLTILFPLSLGGTVNDLANALNLPVDSILAVNPGLRADSLLNVSQVVGLPDSHVDRIMQNVTFAGHHAYVSTPSAASPPHGPPPLQAPPAVTNGHGVGPALRTVLDVFNTLNHPPQTALLPLPVDEHTDRWMVSIDLTISVKGADEPLPARPVVAPLTEPEPVSGSSRVTEPATTVPLNTAAVNVDPGKVVAASSSQRAEDREGAFSFMQTGNVVVPTGLDRQRTRSADVPPPIPMDDRRFAWPPVAMAASSSSNGVNIMAPPVAMHAADLHADSRPLTSQLMALLLAQTGGSIMAGATAPVSSQTSPSVDPQALAALVSSMRASKVIDLGAGLSLQFSLVDDRLRRIDAIGQERTPARRTGDGLEEVRISRPNSEDVEQTDEQREQGRRRRAAIAAMRRRRRPRTRRCRYWRGMRRDLHVPRTMRYPKSVDLAEFRRRLPPRYMWNVGT